MKKLQIIILLTITMISGVTAIASAQATTDTKKEITINAKGGMYDHGGTKLGYIDKNNIVRNAQGVKLYFIDKDGNVIGANGEKLGIAKKNGSYYNINGENVLNTKDLDKERCEVLDPQGHNIGIIHKNYKQHSCAIHCYWLEQAKIKAEKKQ